MASPLDSELHHDHRADKASEISARVVVLGCGFVIWVNFWITYAEYVVHTSRMNISHFPVALFASFFLLICAGYFLRRFSSRLSLTPSQTTVILGMGMVGAMVPTSGLMGFFLGVIATPFYFANPENRWAEFFHPHIPEWLAPRDHGQALTWFFDGLPENARIPWDVWLIPIVWWLLLICVIVYVSMALSVILRKPWSEYERLVYPLVSVAEDLMESHSERPAWHTNRLFWVGVIVPFGILVWNTASFFWPMVPVVNIEGRWFEMTREFPRFRTRINFFTLGFAYLANLEVLFSIWFFYLLVGMEVFAFNRIGFEIKGAEDSWSSVDAASGWQSFGGLIVMVLWGIYVARHHIQMVFAHAFQSKSTVDDQDEIISYRSTVFVLIGGVLFILLWLYAAGMSFLHALLFMLGSLFVFLGVARIVAESGLVYVRAPMTPQVFSIYTLGSGTLSDSSMTVSGFTYAFLSQGKGLFMTPLVHAVKLAETIRGDRRKLGYALLLSVFVGIGFCTLLTFYWGYQNGAYNFNDYPFSSGSKAAFRTTIDKMRNPVDTDWNRLGFLGAGATAMGALIFLRYRFPGWPIHPIGFTIPQTYATINSVFAIFLAWGIKSIVMRVGGVRLYAQTRPLFLGMVVGYALGVGFSFCVDWIWFYGQGHRVHSW